MLEINPTMYCEKFPNVRVISWQHFSKNCRESVHSRSFREQSSNILLCNDLVCTWMLIKCLKVIIIWEIVFSDKKSVIIVINVFQKFWEYSKRLYIASSFSFNISITQHFYTVFFPIRKQCLINTANSFLSIVLKMTKVASPKPL